MDLAEVRPIAAEMSPCRQGAAVRRRSPTGAVLTALDDQDRRNQGRLGVGLNERVVGYFGD